MSKLALCSRCGCEVRDLEGFCSLGHPLYPWSEARAARALARSRANKRALRGGAVGLALYTLAAAVVLSLRGSPVQGSVHAMRFDTTRPSDFKTASRRERERDTSKPKLLLVWRLGIYAPISPLGLEEDGTLQVPGVADEAGWYDGGAVPGRRGPAVIVGHYDSRTGPGIFFPLRKLRPGDEVGVVDGADNEFVFEITRIEKVDKDYFPTKAVYAPTRKPTLRLITCHGDIDPTTGHYADNLIAYGRLVHRAGLAG